MESPKTITIQAVVNKPAELAWKIYTTPKHITQWNNASDDWHTPSAKINLKPGGKFVYRMEAKNGSFGFDFNGIFTEVKEHELIAYTIEGGRRVKITFSEKNAKTKVVVAFEAETENSIELQRKGWQAILDNFKRYAEEN